MVLACLHVDTCLLGMLFLELCNGIALCPRLDEMDMIDASLRVSA